MARLGPYDLLRQVGTGGMGQVWLGRRTMAGGATKTFAIKQLAPRHVASSRHREMFLEEARLSMSLDHSNIVKVHEVDESGGDWYMAMEWIDGLTLAQLNSTLRQRDETLPPGLIGFIIGQILRALAYAHEADHRGTKQPVVHRDVSPQNVMLTVTGDVKLLDFGIARFVSDDTSGLYVKGKPRYMSPEQFHGLSREPTIDLFAAGALLHEMLDGGRVFRWQASDKQLLEVVAGGRVPPLDARSTAPELDALRRGLLAPELQRLASARVALARLSTWTDYRDASLELQELVRSLVPSVPVVPDVPEGIDELMSDDMLGSLERAGQSAVGPFNDTLAVGKTNASIDDGMFGLADDEQAEQAEQADEQDDEQETQARPGSRRPPAPPPPPVLAEPALEIDWIAAGRPQTGPNLVLPPQPESERAPRGFAMLGVIVVVIVLAVIGAMQLAR